MYCIPFLLLVKAADHGILPELTSESKGTFNSVQTKKKKLQDYFSFGLKIDGQLFRSLFFSDRNQIRNTLWDFALFIKDRFELIQKKSKDFLK